jgi:hypothetical protein
VKLERSVNPHAFGWLHADREAWNHKPDAGKSDHALRSQPVAMVVRKLPYLKDIKFEDRRWALWQARQTDDLLQRYCYSLGNMIIVPHFYTNTLRGLLDERKEAFKRKGYDAVLKIFRPMFDEAELLCLRTQILTEIKDQVKEAFQEIQRHEDTRLLADRSERISHDMNKAKELLLLFNLQRAFPVEALKISILIDQLQAKLDGAEISQQEFGR